MLSIKTHFLFLSSVMAAAFVFVACKGGIDFPTEFPTPPPPPAATPLPKIELKPDSELEKKIAEIAKAAKGKVGVAVVVIETGESVGLNNGEHFPMQSVYKLPIAMAVMDQIRQGNLELDEKIGVTKEDMARQGQASPLRDANPNGGEFTIRELIGFALMQSDGTASDVLMRVAGGSSEIQSYLTQIGIQDIKVVNTEKEIGRDWEKQYQNWATPLAAVEVLHSLVVWRSHETDTASQENEDQDYRQRFAHILVDDFMFSSVPGEKRLKGLLPKSAFVSHKTGTSGTQSGITAATNDIGIFHLPNGKLVAIAVFVSDSPADEKTREAVIAKIAKAVWDRWSGK